ncbi:MULTISPECIES: hypothetical protein [Enterobacteriaceae]|uniref:phage tail termination protein n=1 Tax=Enterobacteriaceae TaxID=543 RepID=UPI00077516C7|nr:MULTISPECIES: hypothetical protein [Enterobacteriaceae]EFC5129657.1 hypothetical protein [Escherichia coli]EJL9712732.1 hypothetical protein [Escherichia coli]KXP55126.1 hypothetical protein AUQ19_06855 [Escherichia coli]MEA3716243.1 hypothetical protein [Enterobacter hormaechei]MSG97098.1 hypothetical protein [Escherichia coli]
MTPPMYKRFRNVIVDAGLTTGYIVQSLLWSDSGKLADRFIVFRPNGGTAIDRDMAADYYVLVDLITGKSLGDKSKAEDDVQAIIDYVKANPMTNRCLGQISNMGGIPSPVMTTEGRMVWRLQFACLFGG